MGFSDPSGIRCANAALIPEAEASQAKIIGSCGLKCTKTEVSPLIPEKLFLVLWSISIGNPLLTADTVAIAMLTDLEGIFHNTSVALDNILTLKHFFVLELPSLPVTYQVRDAILQHQSCVPNRTLRVP